MGVLLRERGWDREREGVGFFSWGSSITGWGQKRNTKDSEPIISVPIAPSLNPHALSRTHSDVCWFVATFPGSANLLSEATPNITRTEASSVLSECVYTCVFKTQSYAIKQNITSFFLSLSLSHTQGSAGTARSHEADIPCSGQLLSFCCRGNVRTMDEHPLFKQIPKTHISLVCPPFLWHAHICFQ